MTLSVEVLNKPDKSLVKIEGLIDDRADFVALQTASAALVELDFKGVKSVNSFGIRKWISAVQGLTGKKIHYLNCPVELVRQINLVPSLTKGVSVRSFGMPYECDSCAHECEVFVETERFLKEKIRDKLNTSFVCEKCDRSLNFLDDEDIYFAFLGKSS